MKIFEINDEQLLSLYGWEAEHNKTCPLYDDGSSTISKVGAIGAKDTFCFTPTGLGDIVVFKCLCGEECNLTEYEKW